MQKYEYKTIRVTQKEKGLGFASSSMPDLENILNQEGIDRWRLCEIVQPAAVFGATTAAGCNF